MNEPTIEVKEAVRSVVAQLERRKALLDELDAINKTLREYGVQFTIFTRGSERKEYPPISVEAVSEYIKRKGSTGTTSGELQRHFGQKFAKWQKANQKAFNVKANGNKRVWLCK